MNYNIDIENNINKKKYELNVLTDRLTNLNLTVNKISKEIEKLKIKKQNIEKVLSKPKLSANQLKNINYFNETAPKLKLNDKYLVSAKLSTYGIATVKYNKLFQTNMLYYNNKYIIQSKNVLDTINKLYTTKWDAHNHGISISPSINVYKGYHDKKVTSLDYSKYKLGYEYKKFINLNSSIFTFPTKNLESNLKSKDLTTKRMTKTVLNNLIYDK